MLKIQTLLPVLALAFLGLESCSSSGANSTSTTDNTATAATDAPAATDAAATPGLALEEAQLSKAKTNFATYCSGCHGDNAATFADRRWKYGTSNEELTKSIKHGIPDAGMPAFAQTFSDDEVQALVVYIKEGIQNVDAYKFEEKTAIPDVYNTATVNFKLEEVVSGVGVPWGMAFLPNGDMLITDRGGTLYRFNKGAKLAKVQGAPEVLAEGQGGLLDVELHPNFKQNNLVYLSYSAVKREEGKTTSTTAIMRAKLNGDKLTEQKVIFEALPYSSTRHHYGSRIEFGRDGFMYFTMGDRGDHFENAQSLQRNPGKTHRIKDDGSIPADNPFVNQQDALKTIYTYGNRNAQGMVLHPQTGEMWQNEHGPRGGDEVNIVKKGANYGWPVISYGINYNGTVLTELTQKEDMEQPLWLWTPSIGPSGMAFITGNRYKGWEGDLLVGSLRFQFLSKLKMDGDKIVSEEKLLPNIGRVREVKMSPDGYIHVGVETGHIYRLVPVE